MSNIISADNLRRAAAIREQIESLESQYQAIISGTAVPARRGRKPGPKPAASLITEEAPAKKKSRKRNLSPEARERIRAAVKARWAREKALKKG